MTIKYDAGDAICTDVVGVDDADALIEWLLKTESPRVDLSSCTHLHPACLQVLMASAPTIRAWPDDASLANWLKSALDASVHSI